MEFCIEKGEGAGQGSPQSLPFIETADQSHGEKGKQQDWQ